MTNNNWSLKIDVPLKGQDWSLSLTASEDGLLTMLRMMYTQIEQNVMALAIASSGSRPMGMLEDFLLLNRCMVFSKFEEHDGKFIKITRVH
jgi:hypothetical protein